MYSSEGIVDDYIRGSLKQQRSDPAVERFGSTLSALEWEGDLWRKISRGIPLTFRIGEHKGRIDLMSDEMVPGICRGRVGLAGFPNPLIRNGACFHMPVRVPSKAYHHSNYSSEGDEHCQHSISEL